MYIYIQRHMLGHYFGHFGGPGRADDFPKSPASISSWTFRKATVSASAAWPRFRASEQRACKEVLSWTPEVWKRMDSALYVVLYCGISDYITLHYIKLH